MTALIHAAANDKKWFIKLLVDAGADPAIVDFAKKCALHYSMFHHDVESSELLL